MTEAPRRVDAGDQWAKISGVLTRSAGAAAAAERLQVSATQKLDLAQYGLTTLIDELAAVMEIPGRKSRSATLHKFAQEMIIPGSDAQAADTGHRGQALAA